MALLQDLSFWDGRSVDDILEIYERHKSSDRFLADVLSLIVERIEENGATWLLKHHFEQGGRLDTSQVNRIYRILPKLTDWEARLHILQCIGYMPVDKANFSQVDAFVRKGLSGDHKLIRAWSYSGFYELAVAFPELQKEAKALFEKALIDESSAVVARIKNLQKKGFA